MKHLVTNLIIISIFALGLFGCAALKAKSVETPNYQQITWFHADTSSQIWIPASWPNFDLGGWFAKSNFLSPTVCLYLITNDAITAYGIISKCYTAEIYALFKLNQEELVEVYLYHNDKPIPATKDAFNARMKKLINQTEGLSI